MYGILSLRVVWFRAYTTRPERKVRLPWGQGPGPRSQSQNWLKMPIVFKTGLVRSHTDLYRYCSSDKWRFLIAGFCRCSYGPDIERLQPTVLGASFLAKVLNEWTGMALNRAHISAKAADVSELLLRNRRSVKCRVRVPRVTSPTQPLLYTHNHKVTRTGLLPKSNSFFRDPCATFPPNFVKIGCIVFRNPAN